MTNKPATANSPDLQRGKSRALYVSGPIRLAWENYKGARVHLDFSIEGLLIGIEILAYPSETWIDREAE